MYSETSTKCFTHGLITLTIIGEGPYSVQDMSGNNLHEIQLQPICSLKVIGLATLQGTSHISHQRLLDMPGF